MDKSLLQKTSVVDKRNKALLNLTSLAPQPMPQYQYHNQYQYQYEIKPDNWWYL